MKGQKFRTVLSKGVALLLMAVMVLPMGIPEVKAATTMLVGGENASYGMVPNVGVSGNNMTFNGATITGTYVEGIGNVGVYVDGDLNLTLKGDNTITVPDNANGAGYGIFVKGTLTITGTGSLTIQTGNMAGVNACIYTEKSASGVSKILIKGGVLDCTAGDSGSYETQKQQVEASFALMPRDGEMTISGGKSVFRAQGQAFFAKPGNTYVGSYGDSTPGYVLCNLKIFAGTSASGSGASEVSNLTVNHKYAQITFHDMTHVPAKEPTSCTGSGNFEYWKCNGACGKNYSDPYGLEIPTIIVKPGAHDWYTYYKKAATCTTPGVSEKYKKCSTCGKMLDSDGETLTKEPIISALGHLLSQIAETESTCTVKGNIAHWYCSRCNKNFTDKGAQTEITTSVEKELKTHTLVYNKANESTCTQEGNIEYWSCSVCSNKFTDAEGTTKLTESVTVPTSGHSMTHVEAEDSSCTEGGNIEYWHCEYCNKNYADEEGNQEITNVKLETSGHSMTHVEAEDSSCTEDGNIEYWHCENCDKNYLNEAGTATVDNVVITAHGHAMNHEASRTATCTEDGNIEYWHCGICGNNYLDKDGTEEADNVVITASGHAMTHMEAKASTCTGDGNIEYWHCGVCDNNYLDEDGTEGAGNVVITASGHAMTHMEAKASSCTEDGNIEHWHCENCNKNYLNEAGTATVDKVVITASGHAMNHEVARDATCVENGNVEYWHCGVCDNNYLDKDGKEEAGNVVITASGHAMTHVKAKAATCTEDGNIEYWYCENCDKNYLDPDGKEIADEVVISAEGHDYKWKISKTATSSRSGYKYGTCKSCEKKTGKTTIYKISSQKLSFTKVVVNGEQQIPEVIIKDYKGNVLVEGVHYTLTPPKTGVNVGRYKMYIKYKGDYSGSKSLYYTILPKAPTNVAAELSTASSTSGYDDVKITWTKAKNASGYRVYYKKATSTKWTYAASTTKDYYTKKNLSDGYEYDFKVVSYYKTKSSSTKYYDADKYESASVYTLKKVLKPTVVTNGENVEVSWKTIEGATGYQISQYSSSKTTKIVTPIEISEGKAILEAPAGKTRYYKVRAYKEVNGKKICAPWSLVKAYKK